MEKHVIDRRLAQMEAEGTVFKPGVNVGVDITADELREQFDAVVLAGGSTVARDLPIPGGRELDGIHQAMEFLPLANRVQLGDPITGEDGLPPINAKGKKVVIIGGGDTGATAWAPRTVRARSACTSSRSCRVRRRNAPTPPPRGRRTR